MTSEDRENEIEDYVRYLDSLHEEIFSIVPREKVRLWVIGFSQGAATVVRWVTRGNATPDRVILWAGILPPELNAQSAAALSRRAPLTLVLGRQDQFATPEIVGPVTREVAMAGPGAPPVPYGAPGVPTPPELERVTIQFRHAGRRPR